MTPQFWDHVGWMAAGVLLLYCLNFLALLLRAGIAVWRNALAAHRASIAKADEALAIIHAIQAAKSANAAKRKSKEHE